MKNSFFKYFRSGTLVSLIVVFGIALYLAKSHWHLSFAISGAVTMLLIFISKHLWKLKPFKWLFWVDDFSGRYEGVLKYSYIDKEGKEHTGQRKHIKIINQSGSRISIASFTLQEDGGRSSPSYSRGLFVEQTEDEHHYRIIYHYLNEGNQQLGFPPHFGTDVLKFIKQGDMKMLTGGYYTDRKPQTRGDYHNLIWVSNDLNHEF